MGLSSQLASSSLARPGVCTSSTRPASPYEGQVIYETDTDRTLVWNGSGWVFLSTSTANPVGLEFIKTQTVGSAVSSVTVSDAFSSTYDNYRVVLNSIVFSNADVGVLVRPGGDTTAGSYFAGGLFVKYDGTGVGYLVQNGDALGIHVGLTDTFAHGFSFDVFQPNLTQRTRAGGQSTGRLFVSIYQGYHNQATAYTSFTLLPNSGTMTGGAITVYGYRKA